MKLPLIPLTLVAFTLLGCEATRHYNRTQMVTLQQSLPKKPYGTVKLYQAKEEVPGAYDVLAYLSVEGNAGEEAQFMKAFLYRAADIGADGVIFYRGSLVAGQQGFVVA